MLPALIGFLVCCLQDVRRAVLPVLAKLLSDENVREHVPHVLAELLKENKELQATAADADAVTKLALLLQQDGCSSRLKVWPDQSLCVIRQVCRSKCRINCKLRTAAPLDQLSRRKCDAVMP